MTRVIVVGILVASLTDVVSGFSRTVVDSRDALTDVVSGFSRTSVDRG